MVRKNRPRSSSLFLMELILGILFFTIASAICVQIFVKSHVMSQESQALNQAVTLCTNAAEIFAGTEEEHLEQGVTTTYFDQNFKECKKADASYLLQVDIYKTKQREDKETRTHVADAGLKSSDLFYADIMVSKVAAEEETLYELHTAKHFPRRVKP